MYGGWLCGVIRPAAPHPLFSAASMRRARHENVMSRVMNGKNLTKPPSVAERHDKSFSACVNRLLAQPGADGRAGWLEHHAVSWVWWSRTDALCEEDAGMQPRVVALLASPGRWLSAHRAGRAPRYHSHWEK